MQRNRVLIVFGIAWFSALVLSYWVFRRSSAPQAPPDLVSVVAAAKDLPAGTRLQAGDLKLVSLNRKDLPKGAFTKTADVVDHAVVTPLSASEIVLGARLAGKGTGEGLSALIEPGTRAISVQVNEISGVSGFIQPGTRVDVLFTRTFANGDAATATILQNVKVLAYGKQLEAPARIDPAYLSHPGDLRALVRGLGFLKLLGKMGYQPGGPEGWTKAADAIIKKGAAKPKPRRPLALVGKF